uniref:Uncharacterized protein n=1 Tax=Anopheles minimus TaxID=112268 RepID=A0A182W661_9DIPT
MKGLTVLEPMPSVSSHPKGFPFALPASVKQGYEDGAVRVCAIRAITDILVVLDDRKTPSVNTLATKAYLCFTVQEETRFDVSVV